MHSYTAWIQSADGIARRIEFKAADLDHAKQVAQTLARRAFGYFGCGFTYCVRPA